MQCSWVSTHCLWNSLKLQYLFFFFLSIMLKAHLLDPISRMLKTEGLCIWKFTLLLLSFFPVFIIDENGSRPCGIAKAKVPRCKWRRQQRPFSSSCCPLIFLFTWTSSWCVNEGFICWYGVYDVALPLLSTLCPTCWCMWWLAMAKIPKGFSTSWQLPV